MRMHVDGFYIHYTITNIHREVFFINTPSINRDAVATAQFFIAHGKGEWWIPNDTTERVPETTRVPRPVFYQYLRYQLLKFFSAEGLSSYTFQENPLGEAFECVVYVPAARVRNIGFINFFQKILEWRKSAPQLIHEIVIQDQAAIIGWYRLSVDQIDFFLQRNAEIEKQDLFLLLLRNVFECYSLDAFLLCCRMNQSVTTSRRI